MRRLITLLALATMFGVMMVGVAQADPDGSNPNSAFIRRDFKCALFDGYGDIVKIDGDGSLSIVANRHHTTLKCSADVENWTGEPKSRGAFCAIRTLVTRMTVTASFLPTVNQRLPAALKRLVDDTPGIGTVDGAPDPRRLRWLESAQPKCSSGTWSDAPTPSRLNGSPGLTGLAAEGTPGRSARHNHYGKAPTTRQ